MNKKGVSVLGIAALAVFLFAGLASAETITDDTNDVLHWAWNDNLGTYSWSHSVTNKPNIDIKELSCTTDGQQVILKMKVSGAIEDSENIIYGACYNTTDAMYYATYTNGSGMCMGVPGDYTQISSGNVSSSGDTITATVNTAGTGAKSDFYGYAYKYTQFGDTSAEWWGDWIPQDTSPWSCDENNGGGDEGSSGGGGIPGFEIVLLVGAIAIIVALKRR
ncbi:MAG: hypothetical protein U9O96_04935 [Candidatus Thermoplasmatota archaeon]|nr:hypothetical protein [Candidatus Thermoplasmatota archaeon]